jgi:hypothetical protein
MSGAAETTCARKTAFKSKANAKIRAALYERSGGRSYVYECRICGCWHVTSLAPEVQRRRDRNR